MHLVTQGRGIYNPPDVAGLQSQHPLPLGWMGVAVQHLGAVSIILDDGVYGHPWCVCVCMKINHPSKNEQNRVGLGEIFEVRMGLWLRF